MFAVMDYPNEQPSESNSANYQGWLVYYKAGIENINIQLVETDPDYITAETIESFRSFVHQTLQWVHEYYYKRQVYQSLTKARREFILAIKEYNTKGQTRKYFTCLENGREHLESALMHW